MTHPLEENSWEKRLEKGCDFDGEFVAGCYECGREINPDALKSFISTLLAAELLHENNLTQTWLGDIKKAFQKEQTRLKMEGVEVRMKPVWQAIHDGIWAAKNRQKEMKSAPKSPQLDK